MSEDQDPFQIVTWHHSENGTPYAIVKATGQRVTALRAAKLLAIDVPDSALLEEWVDEGVCESVLGEQVEPDGYDSEGSPSWLLALGLI